MSAQFVADDGGTIIVTGAKNPDNNAHWRHARVGGWCEYTGSAFSTGRQAGPELSKALDAFANAVGMFEEK